MNTLSHSAARVLDTLRSKRPLILSLTNNVVQNITANMLLATGGVPVMLTHSDEIRDLLHSCANGMLINVGTLSEQQAQTMLTAVKDAREAGIPWVLDPVAVGLLQYRTAICQELLQTPPAMIRGNASEIIALAGAEGALCRGVESSAESKAAVAAAQALARRTGAAVLVTGETDYATDGTTTIACHNGDEIMTRVTGVGCAMGALAAACLASADTPLQAAVATAAILGIAGERAAARAPHPGSFAAELLDTLDALTPDDIALSARLEMVEE
jgi:hydroxyethylthiazole kinase